MNGGAGLDTLVSTSGCDTMTGGADADTFMFKDVSKGGSILDWQDGVDKIDLSRLENVDDFGDIAISQISATDVAIQFENDRGQTAEVIVSSDSAFDLSQDDFII